MHFFHDSEKKYCVESPSSCLAHGLMWPVEFSKWYSGIRTRLLVSICRVYSIQKSWPMEGQAFHSVIEFRLTHVGGEPLYYQSSEWQMGGHQVGSPAVRVVL